MTWIDIVLVGFVLLSSVLGFFLGGWWLLACVGGGFVGGFLFDVFGYSLSSSVGAFGGSLLLSRLALTIIPTAVFLIPAIMLKRLTSVFFMTFLEKGIAMAFGAVAGVFLCTYFLIFSLPKAPSVFSSQAFDQSSMAKPLRTNTLEFFSTPDMSVKEFLSDMSRDSQKPQESLKRSSAQVAAFFKKLSKTLHRG